MTRSLPVRWRPPRTDAALAAGSLVLSLAQVAVWPIAHPAVSALVAVGSTLPVAYRRVVPTSAALATTAMWLVPTHGFLLLGFVLAGLVFYSFGLLEPALRRVVAVASLASVVGVVMTLAGPEAPPAAIGAVLVVAGPVLAGRLVAHQRAQNAQLRELTAELVRGRAAAELAAVAEERARIARELHDVIGHEVSVIAVQADAAAAALSRAPKLAAAPVAAIRRAAGETLDEMRRVVALLRGPDDHEALHPQPGLADLGGLVERARLAGAEIDLAMRLPATPPPPSLQLTVYRVVQEGLTNTRKHAPGASVQVRVEDAGDHLCVEVVDSGGRLARSPGGGHGLIGMRERVGMHGGTLQAGPTADGFAVAARLPLTVAGRS
ncbi:sensor histidine kinase [Blastococcus atacamensis]|uniref:sensor histidine kinase n=1 Tax=Blastococcus atacamensis TaxID=2070508 RepID=UPI0013001634|nr:histidine kinase [Blastococcus atacamensis]